MVSYLYYNAFDIGWAFLVSGFMKGVYSLVHAESHQLQSLIDHLDMCLELPRHKTLYGRLQTS